MFGMNYVTAFRGALALLLMYGMGCETPPPQQPLHLVQVDPVRAAAQADSIRQRVAVEVAEGLELTLWAVDSLAPDPIALTMDRQGRAYVTRTHRQKNSEFDVRGHRDWIESSLGFETVEDRRAFLHEIFDPSRSEENAWLPDLNGDSVHDWRDLAVEQEEVWRIEDVSGDGIADQALRVVQDFHDEITDVAGALMVRGEDMFIGVGPDLWRLQDRSGEGVMDTKTSISHGFNVHIGFSGHGMSGLTMGPDGKVWWGIGDVGANIVAPDGKRHAYPHQGIICRANPDGSDFEVFAAGLRNTHEFVFDAYGNLISEDNDGDHRGESERLVYIVEGSDAGWRNHWQYGKYTDPASNPYKIWMDEGLYLPRHEGQAAYIVPPIRNYVNGPTGMRYNPGTALGPEWQDKFFLVEFTGSPARANLYAFTLKPEGAGFAFGEDQRVLNGVLATGIEFGPDGALYLADWIDGWGTKDYGRIWKLDVPGGAQTPIRQETQALLQSDFSEKAEAELGTLLRHPDQRVRLEAQYTLAGRGNAGYKVLEAALTQREHQLARVHAIWGIAQQARQKPARAEALRPLLTDADPEIRAQAARWLGDVRYASAADDLIPLLADANARARFFAAEALGRIGHAPAVAPILAMLRANDDQDVYLRHAGSLALARIGQAEPLVALAGDDSRALRVAAVLALRRLAHPGVAEFLADADGYVVAEAARAIHDDETIPEAMPALAALVGTTPHGGEPLLRRALNANFRLGGEAEMLRVAAYAEDASAPAILRAEAVKMLGSWPEPSPLDRVDGRYRSLPPRDAALAQRVAGPVVERLLATRDAELQSAAAVSAGRLQLVAVAPTLDDMSRRHPTPEVRVSALQALAAMTAPETGDAVARALKDGNALVRSAALRLLPELDMAPATVAGLLEPVIATGQTQEQQSALAALGDLPGEASGPVLARLLTRLESGRLSREIELDLVEIASAHPDTDLQARLTAYQTARAAEDELGPYRAALFGGDVRAGWEVFNQHEAAQCVRCHAMGGNGGGVGPDLAGLASRMDREEILRSLVNPSARLAPGYGVVTLTLTNGQVVAGILQEETPTQLVVQVAEAEPMHIPRAQIAQRQNVPSSMPPMGDILSPRELRDLMAFLMRLE